MTATFVKRMLARLRWLFLRNGNINLARISPPLALRSRSAKPNDKAHEVTHARCAEARVMRRGSCTILRVSTILRAQS